MVVLIKEHYICYVRGVDLDTEIIFGLKSVRIKKHKSCNIEISRNVAK